MIRFIKTTFRRLLGLSSRKGSSRHIMIGKGTKRVESADKLFLKEVATFYDRKIEVIDKFGKMKTKLKEIKSTRKKGIKDIKRQTERATHQLRKRLNRNVNKLKNNKYKELNSSYKSNIESNIKYIRKFELALKKVSLNEYINLMNDETTKILKSPNNYTAIEISQKIDDINKHILKNDMVTDPQIIDGFKIISKNLATIHLEKIRK